jgi:hypothetical protein
MHSIHITHRNSAAKDFRDLGDWCAQRGTVAEGLRDRDPPGALLLSDGHSTPSRIASTTRCLVRVRDGQRVERI